MAVPGISHTLFLPLVSSATQGGKSHHTPEELFKASMALYFTQIHHLIMSSWKTFGETISALAEDNEKAHRTREQEAVRLEGQRREAEKAILTPGDKILLHAAHRQTEKFRFFQGQHVGEDTRHLNLPV